MKIKKKLYWYTMEPRRKPKWLLEIEEILRNVELREGETTSESLETLAIVLRAKIANMERLRSWIHVTGVTGEHGLVALHVFRHDYPMLVIKFV